MLVLCQKYHEQNCLQNRHKSEKFSTILHKS